MSESEAENDVQNQNLYLRLFHPTTQDMTGVSARTDHVANHLKLLASQQEYVYHPPAVASESDPRSDISFVFLAMISSLVFEAILALLENIDHGGVAPSFPRFR